MERGRALPQGVEVGDVLLGLSSDGVHSNGFSLVRKLVDLTGQTWDDPCPWSEATIGEALLTPTRLYVRPALDAIRAGGVAALAHITGGGLTENLPRVLPEAHGALVDLNAWNLPEVFRWMAQTGGMAEDEMLKTFNCGIGMILVVKPERADALTAVLSEAGETVLRMGHVHGSSGVTYEGQML